MRRPSVSKRSPTKSVRSPLKSARSPSKLRGSPLVKGQKLLTDFFGPRLKSVINADDVKRNLTARGAPFSSTIANKFCGSVATPKSEARHVSESDSDVEFIETVGGVGERPGEREQKIKPPLFSSQPGNDCVSNTVPGSTSQVTDENEEDLEATRYNVESSSGLAAAFAETVFESGTDTRPANENVVATAGILSDQAASSCHNDSTFPQQQQQPPQQQPPQQNIFLRSVATINRVLEQSMGDDLHSPSQSSLGMAIENVRTVTGSQDSTVSSYAQMTVKEEVCSPGDSAALSLDLSDVLNGTSSSAIGAAAKDPLALDGLACVPEPAAAAATAAAAAAAESCPDYLVSFRHVLETVWSEPGWRQLFSAEERSLVDSVSGGGGGRLSLPAQMLLVRLLQRQQRWLRVGALHYSELGGVEQLMPELAGAQLVDSCVDSLEDALATLSVTECRQLCRQLQLPVHGARAALVQRARQFAVRQTTLTSTAAAAAPAVAVSPSTIVLRHARALLGPCVRVRARVLCVLARVLLLYRPPYTADELASELHTTLSQLLWTLTQARTGAVQFAAVPVVRATQLYSDRDSLLCYASCCRLAGRFSRCVESRNWREALLIYQQADTLYETHAASGCCGDRDAALPPFLRRFTGQSLLCHIRHCAVDLLQRRKDYPAAVQLLRRLLGQQLYLSQCRGHWHERLTLNLHQHLRQQQLAAEAVRQALADQWLRGGRRLSVLQRAVRLDVDTAATTTTTTATVSATATASPSPVSSLSDAAVSTPLPAAADLPSLTLEALCVSCEPRLYVLNTTTDARHQAAAAVAAAAAGYNLPQQQQQQLISASVEDLVLSRLCRSNCSVGGGDDGGSDGNSCAIGGASGGGGAGGGGGVAEFSEGVHCEGASVRLLFALLFWDIIYELPVPDAFRCREQTEPLDLNCDTFYTSRRQPIEARLHQLQQQQQEEEQQQQVAALLIERHWQRAVNIQCLSRWDVFRDMAHAQSLAACMGAQLLSAMCRRYCTDYRFTRSGFPDLTLWNPGSRRCRFVEVKGPNDRLSTKQILWIDFINRNGGSAQVCHVTTVSAKRRRARASAIVENSVVGDSNRGGGRGDGEAAPIESDSAAVGRITRQTARASHTLKRVSGSFDHDSMEDFVI